MFKKLTLFFGLIFLLSPLKATEFGLVSDTIPGLMLDQDSYIGLYPQRGTGPGTGLGEPIPDIEEKGLVDFREAPESFMVTFITRSGFYQGWFVQWGIQGTPESEHIDMSAYLDGSIRFWMKADPLLKGHIDFGIRQAFIPPGSEASKDDLDHLITENHGIDAFDNQWHSIAIPVKDLVGDNQENADLTRMKVLANFGARDGESGRKEFYIDKLRWDTEIPSSLNQIVVIPTPVDIPINSGQLFTANGLDSSGVSVDVWPDWTTDVTGASFDTTTGDSVFLTVGPTETTGIVTATDGGISGTSDVTVVPGGTVEAEEFGVLSDTIEGVELDVDAVFGVFPGHVPVTQLNPVPNFLDIREPDRSMETTVSTNGTTGWFVQHGLLGSPDTESLDMTNFRFGTLRFWFKGESALQDLMTVGIRSGNVPAGTETSSVDLKDHVTFDNQWHPVAIPIGLFVGPPPRASLGQIKTLVSFTVSGDTGGAQKFFVDKVRWDSQSPGSLDTFAIVPANVTVPTESSRKFEARAFDANGVEIDTWPIWSEDLLNSNFVSNQGNEVRLQTGLVAESGSLSATVPGLAGANDTTGVTVELITFNQSQNLYSDQGFFRDPGTDPADEQLVSLDELPGGISKDSGTFFRCTYDLIKTPRVQNPFAVWFIGEPPGETEFMQAYATGFLEFHVRTQRDLFFSIRSENIAAGSEGKIWLSDLGVPLDNQWQKVIISLDSFPNIDFANMQTFFAIGTESERLGGIELVDEIFDVDFVQWHTNVRPPNPDDVLQGLIDKQRPSGLVRSFGPGNEAAPLLSLQQAVTYDNALAAQVYLYNKNFDKAEAIFDAYKTIDQTAGHASGGFWDEYHVDDLTNLGSLDPDMDRLAGPNAWLLNALIHHKALTGSTDYDGIMTDIANWLLTLQDSDGAVRFGMAVDGPNPPPFGVKSTEHNLDCYAVFKSYARISGRSEFDTAADNVLNWLQTPSTAGGAWNVAEQRFNVGEKETGLPDEARALDIYAWAPLALDEDTSGLPLTQLLIQADAIFRNTKRNDLTGFDVDGFDFDDNKDAVWLEGTGHMIVAYQVTGSSITADFFIDQLNRAVITVSDTVQALTYATNGGTGFGFDMDSVNQSASSMAWYLFANYKYNPFRPIPGFDAQILKITTNDPSDRFEWTGVTAAVTKWARSDHYMKIFPNPASINSWGIQIYTDNTPDTNDPHFRPLPGTSAISPAANPMGLLLDLDGNDPTAFKLPIAWSAKGKLSDAPSPFDPSVSCPGFEGPDEAFQWVFFVDQGTPAIDGDNDGQVGGVCDGKAFGDLNNDLTGVSPILVANPSGFHGGQGPADFFEPNGPFFLFVQADFSNALAAQDYKTHITLEYFTE